MIEVIHQEFKERYGSPRIHEELQARGQRCCVNTVAKLMPQHGIAAKSKLKFRCTTDSNHDLPVADNIMEAPVTAVYDAIILYPAPLRDLFIGVAQAGLVSARWTETIHEEWIESLSLPDPDDRHVLAAAIRAGANVIVPYNRNDFPAETLARFDIEAQHAEDFLGWSSRPGSRRGLRAAVKRQRESLQNPPKTAEELLTTLESQGLPQAVARLRQFIDLI